MNRAVAAAGLLLALSLSIGSAAHAQTQTQVPTATLAAVKSRGHLLCGVNDRLPGFSVLNAKGEGVGFEVEICKAFAAAVLGDSRKVKFVGLSAGARFDALRSGAVDVLLRNSTTTLERTVMKGVIDAATIYLDGQALAVSKASGITSLDQLDGKSICILEATPYARNIREWFTFRSLKYQLLFFKTQDAMYAAFYAGKCTAVTQDISALSTTILAGDRPEDYLIIREIVGLSPLGAFVRTNDEEWFNVVRWSFNALLDAEDSDITQANVDQRRRAGPIEERRLLGMPPDDGALLGLSGDWAYNVIRQVGNYSEIFERTLGAGSPYNFSRAVNALWNKGGVMYALPLR